MCQLYSNSNGQCTGVAAAKISNSEVVGSGMAEFALSPDPLRA